MEKPKTLRQPKLDAKAAQVIINSPNPGAVTIDVIEQRKNHRITVEADGDHLVVSHEYQCHGLMLIPIPEEEDSEYSSDEADA